MEPLFFVVAILGCGDGQSRCEPARVMPAHYATMAECRAALPDQIARNTDLSYPVIAGDCRQHGVRIADRTGPSANG